MVVRRVLSRQKPEARSQKPEGSRQKADTADMRRDRCRLTTRGIRTNAGVDTKQI